MKTHEKIKKALKCSVRFRTANCTAECKKCELHIPGYTMMDLSVDALAYIQQLEVDSARQDAYILRLENELETVKRERDAACNVIKQIAGELDIPACEWCKGNLFDTFDPFCRECRTHNEGFEWRGVCPENTGENPSCLTCKHQGPEGRGICMDCNFSYSKYEPLENTEVKDDD